MIYVKFEFEIPLLKIQELLWNMKFNWSSLTLQSSFEKFCNEKDLQNTYENSVYDCQHILPIYFYKFIYIDKIKLCYFC